MSGAASAGLSKQDREELFQRIDHMCRDASSVGEVVTYEGSLDAGATLKVVGLDAKGKINKEQWKNIEQKYGELRTNPTICNMEMFKLILPLFDLQAKTPAGNATPDPDHIAKHPKESKKLLSSFITQWQKFRPQDIEHNDKARLWKKADDHWEESYLNGTGVMYHDITKRISLNGCDGDRTVKEDDKKLEMFIPEIGCNNMTLMFRFNANAWQPFGIIANYK
jgi:hypothetical protein